MKHFMTDIPSAVFINRKPENTNRSRRVRVNSTIHRPVTFNGNRRNDMHRPRKPAKDKPRPRNETTVILFGKHIFRKFLFSSFIFTFIEGRILRYLNVNFRPIIWITINSRKVKPFIKPIIPMWRSRNGDCASP